MKISVVHLGVMQGEYHWHRHDHDDEFFPRAVQADLRQCKELYGSPDLYAVSKRQISTREIKAHQLR